MESDSDNSLNFKIPPLHPYEMTLKDLSLTGSPYPQPPSPTPDPPDLELLKKLQLTADDFDDSFLIEQPKNKKITKFEPEPELEDLDAHLEDVPTVGYSSEASKDIVADFNREITLNKRHQVIKRAKTQGPCPKCYQYLLDHEDYPLDDFEEMNVSIRSPATNREKIKEQLKDLQADLQLYQDTCPAAAGIPVTTPRRSVYPKRPMSFNPDREPEISFLPEVHSTPKQQCCTKKKTTPKSYQNVRFSKPPDTCCYVSTPQGFPILETDTKNFKSGIPKPIRKYPVTDLRKSYSNKNQLKRHGTSKNHRLKKSFRVKNEVATSLSPELTTILPHRPMHKVLSEIFEEGLEECDIFVSTPETTKGKRKAPKVSNTQCNPSQDENVAPITSRSLLNIPKLISDVESLIKEKIEIIDAKAVGNDQDKKEILDPRFIGYRSHTSINHENKKQNTLISEQLLNASLTKLGISLPVQTVLVQYGSKKPSKDCVQQAMVDSLSNCLASNVKTKLIRSKTASTIFQLNGRSLADKSDVWRTNEDNRFKKVVLKQFTLESINNFLDIQPWESKKSFDITDIPRSYFIIGQTPTVPQRNFKSQMPSTTKIKRTGSKLYNKINQNQDIKLCCNKSTSWSSLSTYKETVGEATSDNNNLDSRVSSNRLGLTNYEKFKETVQFTNPFQRPTTPKLHLVSRPLSAEKSLETFVLETNVKLTNKRKPRFYTKAVSRPNSLTYENQEQNTNSDVEKHKKLGYSLPEKEVSLKNPAPKEKVVSKSKYYKMVQLNKCPKTRPEFLRKNIMSKVSDIEKSILPWIDSKNNKLNKSSLSSKKTSGVSKRQLHENHKLLDMK